MRGLASRLPVHSGFHARRIREPRTRADHGLGFETVRIPTVRRRYLFGWLLPAPESRPNRRRTARVGQQCRADAARRRSPAARWSQRAALRCPQSRSERFRHLLLFATLRRKSGRGASRRSRTRDTTPRSRSSDTPGSYCAFSRRVGRRAGESIRELRPERRRTSPLAPRASSDWQACVGAGGAHGRGVELPDSVPLRSCRPGEPV